MEELFRIVMSVFLAGIMTGSSLAGDYIPDENDVNVIIEEAQAVMENEEVVSELESIMQDEELMSEIQAVMEDEDMLLGLEDALVEAGMIEDGTSEAIEGAIDQAVKESGIDEKTAEEALGEAFEIITSDKAVTEEDAVRELEKVFNKVTASGSQEEPAKKAESPAKKESAKKETAEKEADKEETEKEEAEKDEAAKEETKAEEEAKEDIVEDAEEEAEEADSLTALDEFIDEKDFYLQSGSYREFDTVKLASEGKLLSCFGNNAGSAYLTLSLPAAPEQDTALGSEEKGWDDEMATIFDDPDVENYPANPYFAPGGWEYKLRQDEAIVLITKLPGKCKYYSFINYLMFTQQKEGKDYSERPGFFSVGDEESGLYHPIFGSIGNPVNMTNINCAGDEPYDTTAAFVITANKSVADSMCQALNEAGYPDELINVMPIPAHTYRMGLEKGADTFSFLQRISQPEDEEAYEDYLANISDNSLLYRITPKEEFDEDPYENETVIARGTGEHEAAGLKDAAGELDNIRNELIRQYGDDFDYEELDTEIAVPEGLTAYYNDFNAKGDNRDAMYLMTPEFTLNSDEDFIVVYGVNHTASGKGIYSNAVLYAKPMLNGVTSVYDSLFEGSADDYLGDDCEDADQYYVYKMARTEMDDHTAIIEYSEGNEKGKFYGVDNENPLVLAFRSYLDSTGAGPSYYEVVYDRAIVFHKK